VVGSAAAAAVVEVVATPPKTQEPSWKGLYYRVASAVAAVAAQKGNEDAAAQGGIVPAQELGERG